MIHGRVFDSCANQVRPVNEKHQSGLSDMLAAFPPPAQAGSSNRRSTFRQTLRQSASTGWPLPFSRSRNGSQDTVPAEGSNNVGPTATRNVNDDGPLGNSKTERDTRRRCCGLPLWGFITVVVIVIILIAAAVIIPLQFFVFQNGNNGNAQPALAECQASLNCANGGINVISQGVCSCICTNGFTGSDCTIAGSTGCTTATINSTDSTNISNVTLGQAIPRLIESAQTNFSIPLSATAILAKLNTGSLSCASQNALVTFEGRSVRGLESDVTAEAFTLSDVDLDEELGVVMNEFVTLTIQPGGSSTLTISAFATGMSFSTVITPPVLSTIFATTITFSAVISSRTPVISTIPTPTATPTPSPPPIATPSASFVASDDAVDFARVAVLFILQEQTLGDATVAQSNLQRFLSNSNANSRNGMTVGQALNITVGESNTVDLVNFRVDVGKGPMGGQPG